MKKYLFMYGFLFSLVTCLGQSKTKQSLAGNWQFRLDSMQIGHVQKWPQTRFEGATITLPSTLDEAGIGTPTTLKPALNNYVLSNLTRKHQFIGVAYYQREIHIPKSWKNKQISLTLERVIWQSTVYVDGQKIGQAESLIGSHVFDLSALAPGKHLLTIAIDNSNRYPDINVAGNRYPDPVNLDMAHAYTNHTQIKWNGILGEISLTSQHQNAPRHLQVYTQEDDLTFVFHQKQAKEIKLDIKDANGRVIVRQDVAQHTRMQGDTVVITLKKPQSLQAWHEFNPSLYQVTITTDQGSISTKFGDRQIKNKDGNLELNSTRIFLRGNLECVIFPLTGRPPMEKSGWATLMQQAKAYGLNHLRFHSWCPPKAAFEAADEAGMYLQVELPHWSLKVGRDPATVDFLKKEAKKIIADYGNHPSFLFFSLGNELEGDAAVLNEIVSHLKKQDDRRLYATTSFSFQKPMGVRPEPEDDFFITQWTEKGWVRGQGIFNDKAPHFDKDYTENSAHINIPLITHEIGQYAVYPDLREIPAYTGVLTPLNFMAVQEDLKNKGLLHQAADFTLASGKLAAILYKEEIERCLKTPNIDGFQLLQLQDFPGQGTALVGLLNAFWESKGIISASEFKKFNGEMVPLIRFPKAVYESGETFTALIELANFFEVRKNQALTWTILDEQSHVLATDTLRQKDLSIGNNLHLGTIVWPLQTETAKRLTIRMSLLNTDYENEWSIWIYPKEILAPSTVFITSDIQEAKLALEAGRKVLFNPPTSSIKGINGRFTPVFWSPVHFPEQPGTMGLLIRNNHPAFATFPSETHANWHWWDLCIQSKSVILDGLNIQPLIQNIDNFVSNHHLASLFEARVGQGTLVFSSMDILSDLPQRPVARQLRNSVLQYMESSQFRPKQSMTLLDLHKFIR